MNFKKFCGQYKYSQKELFAEFFELFKDTFAIKNKKIATQKLQTIISATFKLSASQSFANMTLRQLCEETKMSMGGLYAYIKNKQQLSLYIHQFLNHHAEKIMVQVQINKFEDGLETLVHTHIYLSEILRPWFFFAFMESKNLSKSMRKYAIQSELMMESKLIDVIEKGQKQGFYNTILSAETIASHIKPLLHDWYLKPWKHQQRDVSIDNFCRSVMLFINLGLTHTHDLNDT